MKLNVTAYRDHPKYRGFTMIELLVVIAIIAVLAGIVVNVSRGAPLTAKRKKTITQIRAMEEGLEGYKNEYGNYPRPPGGSKNALDQAKMLYQAVSGDGGSAIDNAPDPAMSDGEQGSEGEIFMDSAFAGSKKSSFVHPDYYLMDPWRMPYNYMRGDEDSSTFNKTTFDIWSYCQDFKEQADEDVWISNWQ